MCKYNIIKLNILNICVVNKKKQIYTDKKNVYTL